jgi:hypothetical protein
LDCLFVVQRPDVAVANIARTEGDIDAMIDLGALGAKIANARILARVFREKLAERLADGLCGDSKIRWTTGVKKSCRDAEMHLKNKKDNAHVRWAGSGEP